MLCAATCTGAPACGGSVSTRSTPAGVDAGATEGGGIVEAGVAEEAAPATGPKCGLAPTTVIDQNGLVPPDAGVVGISAAMDLAVSATDVYVAVTYGDSSGAVLRAPIRGGTTSLVTTIDGAEQALLVTGDSVVFAQARQSPHARAGDIVRVGLDGSARTVLASDEVGVGTIFGPSGVLASDGTNVYFAVAGGTKSVPLAGGTVQTLSVHTGSIAVVGTDVVIADSTAEALFEVPLQGGAETTLATGFSGTLGPVIPCGAGVCWASAVPVGPSQAGTGTLSALAALAAGTPTTVASDGNLYFPYRLVFDGSHFFMTTFTDASPGFLATVPGGRRRGVRGRTGCRPRARRRVPLHGVLPGGGAEREPAIVLIGLRRSSSTSCTARSAPRERSSPDAPRRCASASRASLALGSARERLRVRRVTLRFNPFQALPGLLRRRRMTRGPCLDRLRAAPHSRSGPSRTALRPLRTPPPSMRILQRRRSTRVDSFPPKWKARSRPSANSPTECSRFR